MAEHVVIINLGSASKKFALYSGTTATAHAHLEQTPEGVACAITSKSGIVATTISDEQYIDGFNYFWNEVGQPKLAAAGIRIVCPGTYFTQHHIIDDQALTELERWQPYAPAHITPTLAELKHLQKQWPDLAVVGISDSTAHTSQPPEVKTYAIPAADAKEYECYHYGYHGLSLESTLRQLPQLLGHLPKRVIICHLGSGTSVMAVQSGQSINSSMGFSPLSGVPMSTRVGTIDPAAVLHLLHTKKLTHQQGSNYFYEQGGLQAISSSTGDLKTLLTTEEQDPVAKQTLKHYAHWIRHYIGAYAAQLDGLDCLVFTATAGQRSAKLRRLITKQLSYLNVQLDEQRNQDDINASTILSPQKQKPIVAVISTQEEQEIAHHVQDVLRDNL